MHCKFGGEHLSGLWCDRFLALVDSTRSGNAVGDLRLLSAAGAAGVVDTPKSADSAAETADIGQDWRMFAPDPPDQTWWIATPAIRPDGSSVDAFHDEALARDSPAQADRIASFRWRKYFQKIRHEERSIHNTEYARYLCENREIDSVAIYHGYQSTDPASTALGGEVLFEYDCSGPNSHN